MYPCPPAPPPQDGEKEGTGLFTRIMNSLDMESHDVEVGHMG